MKTSELPTQAKIKEVLHYDPETGVFRWRYSVARRVKPLDVAGTFDGYYYWKICVSKKLYGAHRLAWVYMTGEPPKDHIDHIDGNGTNNAWANLREATPKQNMENMPLRVDSASGFRGVSWHKKSQKWMATVKHHCKTVYAGCFDTAEEASQAAIAKRAELFTHDTGRDAEPLGFSKRVAR